MTQEEKQLLLTDLCARLPYGVKIALKNSESYHHENVAKKGDITIDKLKGFDGSYFSIYHDNPLDWDWYVSDIDVEDIKPYLLPLLSMTSKQRAELSMLVANEYDMLKSFLIEIEFYHKHRLDYRGLIPLGLAIDCTNLNIY